MIKSRDEVLYLVHLMVRGLYDEIPEEPSASIFLPSVYKLAGWNSITGLTWHAARKLTSLELTLRSEWERAALVTMFRRIQFDAERNIIIGALSEQGISSMPIKGAAISSLYPSFDMRSMADNDILYGRIEKGRGGSWQLCGSTSEERLLTMEETRSELIGIMHELGYDCDTRTPLTESHDVGFFKPPFLRFELHHAMLNTWYGKYGFIKPGFFSNPWERAARDIGQEVHGSGHLMKQEREVEYAYFVLHAMKHFVGGGIGLRALVDLRVMLDAWGCDLDWKRVSKILESCSAELFERDLRKLCDIVFDGDRLSDSDEDWLIRMARGGTYGLSSNKSYAVFIQRLAARVNLKEGANLPGSPLAYLGDGRVSRPLVNCFTVVWNARQAMRKLRHTDNGRLRDV